MNNYARGGQTLHRRYHLFPGLNDGEPLRAQGEPGTQVKPDSIKPDQAPGPFPPPVPPPHLQRGLTLYAQGDTLAALWAFSQGVDLEPDDPLGHYLCGLAFQALGHGRQARAEWEMVLTLTADVTGSDGEMPPSVETQWVRGLVQCLLARGAAGAEERPAAREVPAVDQLPQVGSEGAGAALRSQRDLEAAIQDAVRRHGGCYVQERSIAAILRVTTEEQVVGWQQSFSARAGLSCRPYRKTDRRGSHPGESPLGGVVFERRAAPQAGEAASA